MIRVHGVGLMLLLLWPVGAAVAADVPNLWTRERGVDWPRFLGPTQNSKSPETGIRTDWPETGPPVVWHKEIGSGYCAPAVAKGRLFLFDRSDNTIRLTCLKAETGKRLWRFTYPTDYEDYYGYNTGPRSSPVVSGQRVYIRGPEGMLHCLRVTDGKLLWKVDTFKRFNIVQNFFGTGSTPVVEGDLLISQIGGSPPDSPPIHSGRVKPNGTGIVAFEKRTGEVVYQVADELASYTSPVLRTIDGRRWCFVLARGGLLGFHPRTGEIDFHFPWRAQKLQSVNAANPVVVNDRVLISECYGPGSAMLEVEPGDYELVWSCKDRPLKQKRLRAHWTTPVHHEGYVYGCSGRHEWESELRCLDWKTGEVQWSKEGLRRTALLYVDDHFVVLTERGGLLLIKATPKAFRPVARSVPRNTNGGRLIEHPAWAAPILSHGLMYIRGADQLVCFELIPPKE